MAGDVWVKWYWSDWMSDTSVRLCGGEARSLWMDMLGVMAGNTIHPGHLEVNGAPVSPQGMAVITGASVDSVNRSLAELERNGVFSRTAENVIYCRRMVRDAARQKKNRVNGKKGGNPKLLKTKENPVSVNHEDKASDKVVVGVSVDDAPLISVNPFPGNNPEARSQKEERGRRGGDASARDAPSPLIDLTNQIIELAGADPSKSAPWMSAAVEVQKWVDAGHDPELDILPAIRGVMTTRNGYPPPDGPRYFFKAVARHRAERLAALPPVDLTAQLSANGVNYAPRLSRDDEERRRRDRDRKLIAAAVLRGMEPDGRAADDFG